MEIVTNSLSSINSVRSESEGFGYNPDLKSDLKEVATEMISEQRILGESRDKKGLEEITDPTLGGDIRHALKSRNIDFLKRLRWGGLTLGELREVTHRIRELEQKMVKEVNILSGKIIDTEA